MSTSRDFGVGFFDAQTSKDAIVDLSGSDRITIFAGAGVSADQAVATWSSLVRNMLEDLLPSGLQGLEVEVAGQTTSLSGALVDSYFQLPMASAVDQLLSEKFGATEYLAKRNGILRRAIYGDPGAPRTFLQKPSIARDLLLMAITLKACGKDVVILTTNYDCVLEEILVGDAEVNQRLTDYGLNYLSVAGTAPPKGLDKQTLPVVHIHGCVPRAGDAVGVVFSEPDYVTWMDNGSLRSYIYNRFDQGHMLMTGTSLRDYNIVTYLKQTDFDSAHRYALLPVKGDAAFDVGEQVGHSVTAAIQQRRASLLGIQILSPDFYGQVRQFFTEVSLAAVMPGANTSAYFDHSYDKRVRAWADDFSIQYKDSSTREAVTSALQHLAAWINANVPEAEHTKVELWARSDIDSRNIELWCSSQTLRLDTPSYWPHRVQIELGSLDPAVISFANRSATEGRVTNRQDGRWTHFVASPVILFDAPYNDVPVGTIVALLHAPSISQGRIPGVQAVLHDLTTRLADVGRSALLPT